jgi:hypothetical protein
MSEKPEALRLADALYGDAVSPIDLKAATELRRLHAENERLREALRDTTLHLGAAVDLLKRGGKKAAASDKMFVQMLDDYTNSFERGRAALRREET